MIMFWNYRVVMKQLNEDEVTFDVCEMYYDENGTPVSYPLDKNVLSQGTYEDLKKNYKIIEDAYKCPVLKEVDGQFVEMPVCPNCGKEIGYSKMDVLGNGNEEDFGQTILVCPQPKGCGYTAVRPDYEKQAQRMLPQITKNENRVI